nr:DUF6683 family protein [uncultured Sphingomonas sp.]
MKKVLGALGLLMVTGWSSSATAQMWDSTQLSLMMPSMYRTDPLSVMLDDRMRQDEERSRRSRRSPAADGASAAPTRADASVLHYTPSRSRRSANLAAFVQKTRAVDPRGAADLQKVFAEGDFIERIGALVAPHGLRVDNVADAYAVWWITAWHAARGNNDEPPPATLTAVRAQAASAILATGEIASASDAQKQELAEALWIQSTLIDISIEQAKGDAAHLRQIGDAVRKGAKGMGLNLDAIDLTSQGFVPAGVGQNDAPATTPKQGSAAPYGALALAAGGMGVGGFLLLRQRRS